MRPISSQAFTMTGDPVFPRLPMSKSPAPSRWLALITALPALLLGACATPRVQPMGEPTQPPRLEADHARMADGAALPLRAWLPGQAPRGVVLALHGFNDYRRSFEPVGALLAARGFALYAYDQRGHGATAHAGLWPGTETLAADARSVAALLGQRHPGQPLYLLGESMGAAVALEALREDAAGFSGLVLLAPALWSRERMPVLQRGALWLAAHTLPGLRLTGRGLDLRPSDNPEALRQLRDDPLVIKKTRVDALWGMARLMDRAAATPLPAGLPTLILLGAQDQIIPARASCRWLAAQPAGVAPRLVVYPRGYHLLTRDLQAATVLEDLAAWLAAPQGALPSGLEVGQGLPALCGGEGLKK